MNRRCPNAQCAMWGEPRYLSGRRAIAPRPPHAQQHPSSARDLSSLCIRPQSAGSFMAAVAIVPHILLSGEPAVGASGAISGIVGMFLVFHPRTPIKCTFVFPFGMWNFHPPSYLMILMWVFFDILGAILGSATIAYSAHLAGFAAGFATAWLMVARGWVKMKSYETSLLQVLNIHKAEDTDAMPFPKSERSEGSPYSGYDQPNETESGSMSVNPPKKDHFISFHCRCGGEITTLRKNAGQKRRCPKCSRTVRIPDV